MCITVIKHISFQFPLLCYIRVFNSQWKKNLWNCWSTLMSPNANASACYAHVWISETSWNWISNSIQKYRNHSLYLSCWDAQNCQFKTWSNLQVFSSIIALMHVGDCQHIIKSSGAIISSSKGPWTTPDSNFEIDSDVSLYSRTISFGVNIVIYIRISP